MPSGNGLHHQVFQEGVEGGVKKEKLRPPEYRRASLVRRADSRQGTGA